MQIGEIEHSTDHSYDEFFRAYGSAMFAWQKVETALFKLYYSVNVLTGRLDIMASANAYYRKKSFSSKLTLVSKLAQHANVHSFIDWISLERDLKNKSVFRNSLAHRPAHLVGNLDGSISVELGDPIFEPLSLRGIPGLAFKYDTAGCLRLYSCFKDLAQRIDAERERIPHQFANNKLITQTKQGAKQQQ